MALPFPQELTEHIVFRNVSGERDAVTRLAATTTVFAHAWARIEETGGTLDDATFQHQVQARTFEIVTQWIDGVDGFMEIAWGSRRLTMTEPPQKVFDRHRRPWTIIRAQEATEEQAS